MLLTSIFTLQNPTREHYEFLGWTYEGISTPTLSVSVNPAAEDGDKVFTANWKPTQYTVRYIVNGGEHIGNPTTFTVEDLPISLNSASKYELHFTGWYSDSEFINSITSITTPGDKTLYAKYIDDTDGLFYELNESADGYVVTGYDGISKQVYIAYKQNGLPVVAIADGVFKNSAISEIIIPEGIVSIGAGAFSGCTSLLRISIPSTLCYIGGGAFNGCDPRLSYTVSDGVYYLGNESSPYTVVVGAVAGSVNEITVKDGAKIINTRAFENVSATVKKITLPEGITQLCDDAFAGLTNLTELNIPDSLEYVGTRAFHSCTKLNYTVESGIKYLGNEDNPYLVIVSVEKGSEGLTVKASTKLVCSYAFSAITSSVTFEAGSNSGIFIHPTGNDILFK